MDTALWILQAIMAAVYLSAGIIKLFLEKDKLEKQFSWVKEFNRFSLKIIGGLEILGAFGLVLPEVTGIVPVLTPAAALGISLIMIMATIFHNRRKEMDSVVITQLLFVIALFIAYGRIFLV